MDLMGEELLAFWRLLSSNEVRYIMVGGFAVYMQGYFRATGDVDLWLKDEITNRRNLRKSFEELGYRHHPSLETMDFIPGRNQYYMPGGLILNVVTSMKGLESQSFDDCMVRANIADLDGVKVPFLHINDLILNKKAVFRPKNQLDLLELEKIRSIRQDGNPQKNA